jgi:hypothetical protein
MYMTREDRESTLVHGRRLDQARESLTGILTTAILSPASDDGTEIVTGCREMAEAANALGDCVEAIVEKSKTDPAYIEAYSRPPITSLDDVMDMLFPGRTPDPGFVRYSVEDDHGVIELGPDTP